MPSKPGKYGIKIFIITDAKNGYMWDARVYLGKQTNSQISSRLNVVMDLVKPLSNADNLL